MSENPPKNAILQRDKTTYAIVPRIPCGFLPREHLTAIAAVANKYDVPIIKITSGQRIALVGVKEADLEAIYQDLGMEPGRATELCLHYVQACPGTEVCKFGVGDSLGFGRRLEAILAERDLPAKLKVGISGCQFCCAESFVRDIGAVAKKGGWTLAFGGHSGNKPRVGNVVGENLRDGEVIDKISKFLDFYRESGRKKERTGQFIERIGIATVMEHLE